MAGFSGDGDWRILNSMRFNSNLLSPIGENSWFGNKGSVVCFLQDIVHIGTKLRNRILNSSIFLSMGSKIASVSHLKILINSVPKAVHSLVYSDICPEDRQNFDSLRKIMRPNVREALAKYVLGSEGTIEFIRICDEITSSLYDDDLSPLERLHRIFRSTYFLRAWRHSIKQSKNNGLNLDDNFITRNAYQCVELNAKNLLILIRKFRDENLSKYFHPTIFNSQPCEETFRELRSLGTINFTKVNFTFLELMHLIGRVELMKDIMHFKLAGVGVCFPRNPMHKVNYCQFELPSDEEIEDTLKQALNAAINDAAKFGINVAASVIEKCKIKQVDVQFNGTNRDTEVTHIDLGIAANDDEDDVIVGDYLKDYTNRTSSGSNSYVSVAGKNSDKMVRKRSLMWSIAHSREKKSADRSIRVQSKTKTPRRLEFVDVSLNNDSVYKSTEIKIGDWCYFYDPSKHVNDLKNIILGNIMSFRYIDGTTKTAKKYSWDFCPILNEQNSRGVEVLATWHTVKECGTLHYINCSFINIDRYVANVSSKLIEKNMNGDICLSHECSRSIKGLLQNLLK